LAAGLKATRKFHRSLHRPEEVQESILLSLLRYNATSKYGQRYGFDQIHSVREFQRRVPIVTYDDLKNDIEAIKNGEQGVLTSEPVLMLEKTAGSTAATKYIPYTAQLRREFQVALAPWMADLYGQRRSMWNGGAYWSISPPIEKREMTKGGLPVGFETDADYFCRSSRFCLKSLLIVPSLVSRIVDMDSHRYVTLRFLLENVNLKFISVWNPSFLTLLVEYIPPNAKRLIQDIRFGTLSPPAPLSPELSAQLLKYLHPNPHRAAELDQVLKDIGSLPPIKVWPSLSVISCWTSAAAVQFLPEMQNYFPGVEIQPKGLLATEGVVSIPMTGHSGSALAITSHFLEFIDEETIDKEPLLVHQLKVGRTYQVVLTTGGGLYRYALGDRLTVVGHLGATPLVDFCGKSGNVSDLCGEKLSESFVSGILIQAFERRHLQTRFAMIAPQPGQPPQYVLYVESSDATPELIHDVSCDIETELMQNHHYAYCRKLGQLGHLRPFRIVSHGSQDYLRRCAASGQKIGSVKPFALHRLDGWSRWFKGDFIERVPAEIL
jgi:hypothetical protein